MRLRAITISIALGLASACATGPVAGQIRSAQLPAFSGRLLATDTEPSLIEMPDSLAVDRVGKTTIGADGVPDGHLQLTLDLPQARRIQQIKLFVRGPDGKEIGTGWRTGPSRNLLLYVVPSAQKASKPDVVPLGTFGPGKQTFDLYGEQWGGAFGRHPMAAFWVRVVFAE